MTVFGLAVLLLGLLASTGDALNLRHLGHVTPAAHTAGDIVLSCKANSTRRCNTNPDGTVKPLWGSHQIASLSNFYEEVLCKRFASSWDDQVNKFDVSLLDDGADPTGNQLGRLARCITQQAVGINVQGAGIMKHTTKYLPSNALLVVADGQHLPFQNQSFDAVFSSWIVEHVPSVEKYVEEQYRVLRPGGVSYVEWGPAWSSAMGHHILTWKEGKTQLPDYELPTNTTVCDLVPGWAHLVWTPEELRAHLSSLSLTRSDQDMALEIVFGSGPSHSNRVPFEVANVAMRHPPWADVTDIYTAGDSKACSDAKSQELLAEARQKHPELHDFVSTSQCLVLKK